MWRMCLREPGGWLIAGGGLIVAGFGLARFWWFEFGMALILLGAAALGYLLGLARSAALDAELTERIDRQLDELREEQRRALEVGSLADGASASERSWRALANRDTPDEDSARAQSQSGDTDRRLAELIRKRCDSVWQGIEQGRYWRQAEDQTIGPDLNAIGQEVQDVVREVAGLYHQNAGNPIMEARLGDIVLTSRSILGEVLQVARLAPVVDLPGRSVATVKTMLEQARQLRDLYRRIAPYTPYLNYASIATRFALGVNPVTLAAWFLGGRALSYAGTRVAEKYLRAWLRDALEDAVALVYEHVARTYDPRRVPLSVDSVALVEALDVQRRIPGIDLNRKLLLDRILRAPIPDEFAKMTLLRALADDGVPDATEMPRVDFMSLAPAKRQAIADRLAEILPAMRGLADPDASQAIEDLEVRLSRGLPVDIPGSGSRADVRVEEGFVRLAVLACDWCRFDLERARTEISASAFANAARQVRGGVDPATGLIEKGLDAAFDDVVDAGGATDATVRRLVDPPRDLVGDAMAAPLVDSIIDLLGKATPNEWPLEHDHIVLLNASVLLGAPKQVQKSWERYLATVSTRLRGLLKHPEPSDWPEAAAPAILRQSGGQEFASPEYRVVTPPPTPQPLAVFKAGSESGPRWVLLFANRAVVGCAPEEIVALDDAEPEVHGGESLGFLRRKGRLADDLVVCCGDHRLTVAGPVMGTFIGHFGPVLQALDLDANALEVINP